MMPVRQASRSLASLPLPMVPSALWHPGSRLTQRAQPRRMKPEPAHSLRPSRQAARIARSSATVAAPTTRAA